MRGSDFGSTSVDAGSIRIGIVMHDLSLGGTERIALRLATEWARQGAAVTVFCGARTGALRALPLPGLRVVEAAGRIERRPGSRRRLAIAAARYFLEHPVDACFLPGNFHWPVAPALARLPAGVRPRVVAQVSAALEKPQRKGLRKVLFESRMRRLLRATDGIVCMSRGACTQARRILQRELAVRIALPALDDDCPPPVPVAAGCRTFVAAGRLVREKGFHQLIDAFALLHDASARLVIVGTGPEEGELYRQVWRLGLAGRVRLVGYRRDIRPWLDEARALVLSSHYEGFAAVLVEALAAGRQVIATRCTQAIDELDIVGEVGTVVPVGDVGALAEAMRAMLASAPASPEALAARVTGYHIGALAREYLRAFGRRATADDLQPASVPAASRAA